MNAVVGRLRAWISGHERELALALGLTLLAVLTFLLRWEVLIQYPYPPSNDVGGDLYSAQQWLGNPIPGLWVDLQPPLYYWLVVIPAVHFLGPFAGPQVYMALVPALLVFPGYVFGRETGAGVVSSAVGAFGLAMATTLSLMVTWNGAYNALGILFLVLFATFLLRSLKRGRLVDSVAAGISLALVAGTHELSFLVGVIAFVVCAVLSLILVDRRRSTVRTVSIVLATTAICFVPLLPIYWSSLIHSANGGVGGYQNQLIWAYTYFLTFAWGFQGPTQSLLALVDVAVGTLGLLVLWSRKVTRHSAIVVSSLWVAGLAVSFASASNSVRGLYYLTLPATLVVPAFFEYLLMPSRADPTAPSSTVPVDESRSRLWRWRRRLPLDRTGLEVAAIVVVSLLTFTYLNASFSVQNMEESTKYYLTLSRDNVNAIHWLGSHTNESDNIMDTIGVQPWIWGLSHRIAYAPIPLGVEATAASFASSKLADYVWLGTHLAGNSRLTITDNAPSPLGVPDIFVNVPGYWQEMVTTQSDLISFGMKQGNTTSTHVLVTAALVSNNSSVLPSGDVQSSFSYWWNDAHFGVNETLLLTSSALSIRWTGWNASVASSTTWFGLPPPKPPFVDALVEPTVNRTPLIQNQYDLDGVPFTMSFGGGTFHQTLSANGWAYVWCNSTGPIDLRFGGLPFVRTVTPFVQDTSASIHDLGIDYFLSDPNQDYTTFLRLVHDAVTGATVRQVFQSGTVYIFQVTFPTPLIA